MQDMKARAQDIKIAYRLGQFIIDIPASLQLTTKYYNVNFTSVEEFHWDDYLDPMEQREQVWKHRMNDIHALDMPSESDMVLLDNRDLSEEGKWAKAVFYRNNPSNKWSVQWDALMDAVTLGVWFHITGTIDHKQQMEDTLRNMIRRYRAPQGQNPHVSVTSQPSYYFQYGAVDLTHIVNNKLYARFVDQSVQSARDVELKLEIGIMMVDETSVVDLVSNLAGAFKKKFGDDSIIDIIRKKQRLVAGFEGTEVIVSAQYNNYYNLSFAWRYEGVSKDNSHPEILVRMKCGGNDIEDKLSIWDAMLRSFRPVGQNKPL